MCVPLKTKDTVNRNARTSEQKRRTSLQIPWWGNYHIYCWFRQLFPSWKRGSVKIREIMKSIWQKYWLESIDFSDYRTRWDTQKGVARYSHIMAKALKHAEESQKKLYFASLLHWCRFSWRCLPEMFLTKRSSSATLLLDMKWLSLLTSMQI